MGSNRALYFYGYGLLEAWVFESFITSPNDGFLSNFILAIGMIAAATAFIAIGVSSNRIERISAHPTLGLCAMTGATICSFCIELSIDSIRIPLTLVTSFFIAYLYLAWGEVYSHMDAEDAESISLGSAFVVIVAIMALAYAPIWIKTTAIALLPMASFIAYRLCMSNLGDDNSEKVSNVSFGRRSYAAVILGAGVPSTIAFLFIGITLLPSMPAETWGVIPSGLIVFVLVFLLYIRHTPAFTATTMFITMGSISVVVCLSCGFGLPEAIPRSLTVALWLSQNMLCWLLFTRMYREGYADCIQTYAFGQTVMFTSAAVGSLIASAILAAFPNFDLAHLCLAVSAALFATMIVLSQLTSPMQTQKQPQSQPDPQSERREILLAKMAKEYGLTKRESEVFVLLVNGRSAPFIRDQLYISESTVRSHIKHIHTKLGVTTKQETISLAEDYIQTKI